MILMNEHYGKLQASYLFSDIAGRIKKFQAENPGRDIIRLGIGDVTMPLPQACTQALHKAVDEMGAAESFRGYGPEQGYEFLRQAVADNDYASRGVDIGVDDIFVSDGAKCDTGNFQELFSSSIRVAIPDPVYPVYLDTNVMAGRTGNFVNGRYEGVTYLESRADNGFVPLIPDQDVDLIYLCFPNNPTGATIDKEHLQQWVDYARERKALILFDAAYEAFIRDPSLPHSIYEIPGAREVAVEFRSFSKTAGFTGTRCAFTVVPGECMVYDRSGKTHSLRAMWNRRHSTKFNGVSYPVQRAAEAAYSPQGRTEVRRLTDYYLQNADLIRKEVKSLGLDCVGGKNSPYIWVDTGGDSWDFFDLLLNRAGVVCTPGAGFGRCGQGYIRISAFNSHENVVRAMERVKEALS